MNNVRYNKNIPNWCTNTLKVKGEEKILQKFKKKAQNKKNKLSLTKFLPLPKGLEGTQSPPDKKKKIQNLALKLKYGTDNWYDWAIKNWGIKWDIKCEFMDNNEDELIYEFDSPWGPPLEGFRQISKKYPKLVFFLDYDEPGMAFKGISKMQKGKLEDHCINY
ncbi:hypothetical protein J4438_03910 [Candidatus Woesearchaeota archaeon]|nr:hypothetical protein [Candidatus Woesearchaeota archaeon]